MGLYKNSKDASNTLVPIAGRGKAEYGASTVRKGGIDGNSQTIEPDGYLSQRITFAEPMPDANYEVILNVTSTFLNVQIIDKKAGYIDVEITNSSGSARTFFYLSYTAFKLYTDTEYNGLIEDVAEIKSDLLYSEIKSSGSISETITANSVKAINIDVAKTGYVPIGIIGIDKTGTSTGYGAIVAFKISNNDAVVTIDNTSTSSITITRIDVTILYKKA